MKKRLRSPAVLLVAFAMVVVTAGVVYAHWSSTSAIEGSINTGNIGMGWENVGTNDDGDPFNDGSGNDGDTGTIYDGTGTADDPRNGDDPTERYLKDVAQCFADGGGGGDMVNLYVDNAYPSYVCHLYADAFNYGSVPVKAAALTLAAERGYYECTAHISQDDAETGANPLAIEEGEFGQYIDFNTNGVFDDGFDGWYRGDNNGPYADFNNDDVFNGSDVRLYDNCVWVGTTMSVNPTGHPGEFVFGTDKITFHIEKGITCGTQIDPNAGEETMGWLHVEQLAEQNSQYRFMLTQEWVNWNEWDASMCTFNGVPIP